MNQCILDRLQGERLDVEKLRYLLGGVNDKDGDEETDGPEEIE